MKVVAGFFVIFLVVTIPNPLMSQGHFKISFERSGGFTGIPIKVELDSDSLSVEEQVKIRQWIDESNFFDLQEIDSISKDQPDQFYYQLSIETPGNRRSTEYTDMNVPDDLRPLFNYLVRLARARK